MKVEVGPVGAVAVGFARAAWESVDQVVFFPLI